MKKEYGTPKAEKMEFNYVEAVAAASQGIKCKNETKYTEWNSTYENPCNTTQNGPTVFSDVMPGQ